MESFLWKLRADSGAAKHDRWYPAQTCTTPDIWGHRVNDILVTRHLYTRAEYERGSFLNREDNSGGLLGPLDLVTSPLNASESVCRYHQYGRLGQLGLSRSRVSTICVSS
jgi:hypothetical protein